MNDFLNKIPKKMLSFFKKENGVAMVEYAIMLALITILSLAVIKGLGQSVSTTFNTLNTSLTTTG
jgi:pilus assembly protein Flp/PilA